VSVKRTNFSHSRQLFHTNYSTVAGGRSVAYTVLVWSRLNAPMELSTRYTTPDATIEIGSSLYECDRGISSFNTHISHSRQLFNIHVNTVYRVTACVENPEMAGQCEGNILSDRIDFKFRATPIFDSIVVA